LTEASQNLYELIQGRNIILYPDAPMRLAVSRAVAIEGSRGWRIAKEKQSHKIDSVIALAMAAHNVVKNPSTYDYLYRGFCDNDDHDGARAFQNAKLLQHIYRNS
jgi:phage terminase large subunit-like protein